MDPADGNDHELANEMGAFVVTGRRGGQFSMRLSNTAPGNE
jgi:hypothetical protein